MRFSAAVLVGALAAFVSAQASSGTTAVAPTSTASGNTAQSSLQAQITKCLDACAAGDVPNPDTAQVNATNNCVAACPQGNGTATDNLNYANCVSACIGENYFTSTGTPAPTNGAGAGAAGGSAGAGASGPTGTTKTGSATGAGKTGTATGTGTGTATDSGPSATTTKNAGTSVRVTSSVVGLLGFFAAVLAL
ncbi:hypothetical protein SPI_05190 [Niveomyces insectorum RCEF 264]|uniref:Uncharacterized protein n=1 Tax=Niveomyces insectorum RCEF 264 TaxID=1081102 RepID=A0A167U1X6_9HYPO|nr:hypothetical protein SPI_05190 [Niveomyces insectorum RCEF 264]